MTRRTIDVQICTIIGYRFWLEKRGEYTGAVWKRPLDREPWRSRQRPDPERYTEVDAARAFEVGFFGTEPPYFCGDIKAVMGEVVPFMHEKVGAHSEEPLSSHPWPGSNYLTLSCKGYKSGWAAAFTSILDSEWIEHPERHGGAEGATPAEAICNAVIACLKSHPETQTNG